MRVCLADAVAAAVVAVPAVLPMCRDSAIAGLCALTGRRFRV